MSKFQIVYATVLVAVILAATVIATPPASSAECVPQSVLTWVDNREAVAISPTRWQNVRKSLLEQDGGMSLDAMQVIYDRRVSNGWSAGHWVPILAAMNCLAQAKADTEKAQSEPQQPSQPADEPQAAPVQAEVEPAQEPMKIRFELPPEDDTDAANYDFIVHNVPGTTRPYKIKQVHRGTVNNDWFKSWQAHQSPGAVEPNEAFKQWAANHSTSIGEGMDKWNKWGPWNSMSAFTQSWIEGTLGRGLASWDGVLEGAFGAGYSEQAAPPVGNPNIAGGKAHWSGAFSRYQVHPDSLAAGYGLERVSDGNGGFENRAATPTMVFETTFGSDRNPGKFNAYIDWPIAASSRTGYLKGWTPTGAGSADTLTTSWHHDGERWWKTTFTNTDCRCDTWQGISFSDGTFDDGELSAKFYKTDANSVAEFRRDNSAIAGHVRRAKIIGEFTTGEGKSGFYPQ